MKDSIDRIFSIPFQGTHNDLLQGQVGRLNAFPNMVSNVTIYESQGHYLSDRIESFYKTFLTPIVVYITETVYNFSSVKSIQ